MIYIALILTVFLGASLVFFVPVNPKYTKLLLAFSGAFLLAIVLFHLLPEVYTSSINAKTISVFILIGLLSQMILEFFSDGVEHGHVHSHKQGIPFLLLLSLMLHAFVEGMPISQQDNSFLIGVLVHKLPIAIVITSFLKQSGIAMRNIVFILLFFALMAPLGSYLGDSILFLKEKEIYIEALVIGVLTHVSTTILYESSENHKFNLIKFIIVLSAFILAYFI
jgi:zinc transporter ZupT